MESANSIFPVFGPLHTDDQAQPVLPREQPARRVCANDAGLFVVSVESFGQTDEPEEQTEAHPLRVTGDVPRDMVAALYCLAYLSEFFAALEPGDFRTIADQLGVRG